MKVKTFINTFDTKAVLSGRISFKLITNDGRYGDKWFFWYDKANHKGKKIETIDDFLNDSCEGIREAVNSNIDLDESIEITITGRNTVRYTIYYTKRRQT